MNYKNLIFKPLNQHSIRILFFCLLILPAFAFILKISGIIFSYTGSVPIGFYRIVPMDSIQRGDYISFCLPNNIAAMGLSRGYIKAGYCANGSEELIKQVIAVPGDKVMVSNNKIVVKNTVGILSYETPSLVIDKNHLPVYRFIKNTIYIAKNYWVYGNGNPHYSWDSRYYGGIPQTNIQHRLTPFWQF